MLERREFLSLAPTSPAPSEGFWLHLSRPAMACRFEVTLPLLDRRGVVVARRALEEADRLEEQLSIFKASSEISHLNREAAVAPTRTDDSLVSLLLLCRELHEETGGAFDVTSGPLSKSWGFLRRQGRIPDASEIATALALVGGGKIAIDPELQTVSFEHDGIEINLGSIGKGYALDRIAALIRDQVKTALLSAGSSSMLAIGNGASGSTGWITGIRHPRHRDRRIAILHLRDTAISTSGNEEQFFEMNGKRYGHIIDPRSGQPAEGVSGVTVLSDSAAIADALATAFYVGGPILAAAYCANHPQTMVIMLESGSEQPTVFGERLNSEVEIINE
ncbi:MAG: FAD:protein FMN transferase [Acidobacteriota bacterium]